MPKIWMCLLCLFCPMPILNIHYWNLISKSYKIFSCLPKGGLNERIQESTLLFEDIMKWRQWLKAKLPTRNDIENHRALSWAKPLMNNKEYWKLNEQSISRAVFIGILISFVPLPIQMILAVLLGLFLRANLILSAALVWISNPVTIPPIFYFCYRLGRWLMQAHSPSLSEQGMSMKTIVSNPHLILQPLLLGSLIAGIVCATLGYIVVRLIWIFYLRHHPRPGFGGPWGGKRKEGRWS